VEILGIDIGGTGIKGAPVNISKGVLSDDRYRVETPQPATPYEVAQAVKKLAEHFNWTGKIGCGFPAIVRRGVALSAANIDKTWVGIDVQALFRDVTGCPIVVLNDADAAGIAEMCFGAAKGRSGVVLVMTIGTGIGSALFVDGKLIPNTELGHLQFKGTIAERYCSNATRKREDLSWKEWGTRFDEYVAHLKRLFSPECIILGGGQSRKLEKFAEFIKTEVEILPAQLLNDAGIIGAAIAAREMY
jgi:polyphosphate glucokinase